MYVQTYTSLHLHLHTGDIQWDKDRSVDPSLEGDEEEVNFEKLRGPNGILSSFYVKASKNLCKIMHSVFRKKKEAAKIPDSWKVAIL